MRIPIINADGFGAVFGSSFRRFLRHRSQCRTAALPCFIGFIGFKRTILFCEEAINRRKTILKSLYLVIAFMGLFCILSI